MKKTIHQYRQMSLLQCTSQWNIPQSTDPRNNPGSWQKQNRSRFDGGDEDVLTTVDSLEFGMDALTVALERQ